MQNNTRIFFVVDSINDNEEIYETLEEAEALYKKLQTEHKPRLYIAIVKNAYREGDFNEVATWWNYTDRADTFEIIKIIK